MEFEVRVGDAVNWRPVCGLTAVVRDSAINQNEIQLYNARVNNICLIKIKINYSEISEPRYSQRFICD